MTVLAVVARAVTEEVRAAVEGVWAAMAKVAEKLVVAWEVNALVQKVTGLEAEVVWAMVSGVGAAVAVVWAVVEVVRM